MLQINMPTKRRLIRNGLSAALQKSIRVLDQLLLVPFFLSAWGAAYYGEWLTLMIIPTALGFSDFGFGTAAANTFILRFAASDRQGAANAAASGLYAITAIVTLGLALTIATAAYGPQTEMFGAAIIPKEDAALAVAAMMAARIISFYAQIFEAYFSATRKVHIGINLQTAYSIVGLCISIALLTTGSGIVKFSMGYLIWTMLFTAIYALTAVRTLSAMSHCRGHVNRADLRTICVNGFGYLLSPMWQAIFFQGTTLVVRLALGPIAVTVFNTVRTVTRSINQIYTLVISASISELQYELGSGNFERARKIFRLGLGVILITAISGSIFLLIAGQWLYQVWTHKALVAPTAMWQILIAGIIFNAIWWPSSFIFQAMNRPYDFALAGFTGATASVAISYMLVPVYGLTGAAAGAIFMDIALSIYVLPRACQLIRQPLNSLVSDTWVDCKTTFTKGRSK